MLYCYLSCSQPFPTMINVKDWIAMDAESPESVWEAISKVAGTRDYDSLAAAIEAGIATPPGKEMMEQRLRMALSYVDWVTPDGAPMDRPAWERAEPVLMAWVNKVPLETRNRLLFNLASSAGSYPMSCKLLVACGADPYSCTVHGNSHGGSPLTWASEMTDGGGLDMVASMIPPAPIVSADALPARIIHSNPDQTWEKVNLLAYAALSGKKALHDLVLDRLDQDSAAREVLFQMGDLVLKNLRMDPDGAAQPGYATIQADDKFTLQAIKLIAGGALMRDDALWEKVLLRPNAHVSGSKGPMLFGLIDNAVALVTPSRLTTKALAVLLGHAPEHVDDYHPSSGRTPLMVSAAGGNVERVALLLDLGADPLKRERFSKVGETPKNSIDFAAQQPECQKMLQAAVAKRATERVLEQVRAKQQQERKP